MRLSTVVLLGLTPLGLGSPERPAKAATAVSQIPSALPTLDPSWRTNRTRQHNHVHDFFKLFGWLRPNDTIKDSELPDAIRKVQRVLGEPETGVYDEHMESVLSRPRCGTTPLQNSADANSPHDAGGNQKRYVLWGPKWDHNVVTYRFINYTSDLSSDRQRSLISNAFSQWSNMLPLSILPATTNAKADINIRFKSMGPAEPAYAYTNMIANGLAMASGLINVTFNDDYVWSDDRLFNYTAVHEIGHALGLSHSQVEDAIMWPYYEGTVRALHPDDKAAAHKVYGWREPRWSSISSNTATKSITQITSSSRDPAAWDGLYQLRSSGQALFYKSASNSWTTIDSAKATTQVAGSNGNVYKRHSDGSIYRYTGSGSSWTNIGASSELVIDIVAAGDQIYQRRKDGWIARYSGSGTTWTTIANPRSTRQIAVTDSKTLWNLLPTGDLVRSEWPYGDGWTIVDINSKNAAIATGGDEFYKLQSDGLVVWLDMDAYYWVTIENAGSVAIWAVGSYLYSKHGDGSVWRYTGTPGVWEVLDTSGTAVGVAGDRKGEVWMLRNSGEVVRLVS